MQLEFLIECFAVILIASLAGFLIRKSIIDEEKKS